MDVALAYSARRSIPEAFPYADDLTPLSTIILVPASWSLQRQSTHFPQDL